jgi:uncharacterized protein Yka (UPF0111/DUF47 family)
VSTLTIWQRIRKFRFLPPQDKEFYQQFNQMAQCLVEASTLLKDLFSQPEKKEILKLIINLEIKCDGIVQQVNYLLRHAQQPPFDRDYISELIHELDDIMDHIDKAAGLFIYYDGLPSDSTMQGMAQDIHDACESLTQALLRLPKRGGLDPFCDAVSKYEEQTDKSHHQAIQDGFTQIMSKLTTVRQKAERITSAEESKEVIIDSIDNMVELILYKSRRDVYQALEHASDSAETVTVILKRMVASNG